MDKTIILIVDDEPINVDVLRGILDAHYQIKVAINGETAVQIASIKPYPDLILMDVMMPKMDGYTACEQIKKNLITRHIPVIFVTAKNEALDELQGFHVGAVDYLTKPVNPLIVKSRVQAQLALHEQQKALDRLVKVRTFELEATRAEIIRQLGRAGEFKDNETGLHVIRVSHYSRLIAKQLGLDKQTQELIMTVAPMHDIGKIGIPDSVITKPGKLDLDERHLIEQHPEIGADIIGEHQEELLTFAREIALSHHEKWDGTGYPKGSKGEEIPLLGRIVALADVFDALTSLRPYKKAWSPEAAWELIKKEAGKHFDPTVVEAFSQVADEVEKIRHQFIEN